MRRLIFGGTTEGREAALSMRTAGDEVLVCVATQAGRAALPEDILCRVGRLDAEGMIGVARAFGAEEIVDATHPFAREVSENARLCAQRLGLKLVRIKRESDEHAQFADAVTWADDARAAAELLARERGNIFLSTGANTLKLYAECLGTQRLYVRVLPTLDSLKLCGDAGIPAAQICAMQGPFTAELNRALYRQWHIEHLITKDSGNVGGVREKVLPALDMGIHVIMIRRPGEE